MTERPDLEQRAREMLARECEQDGFAQNAANVRDGLDLEALNPVNARTPISCAIRAITKALASSSVPEQETPQSIPSEREEIVKWLRGETPTDYTDPQYDLGMHLADAIERGEHLTRQALEQGSAQPSEPQS